MKFVMGNWKMNGTAAELKAWQESFTPPEGVMIGLFVPSILLGGEKPKGYEMGAQDVSRYEGKGAFTGEISASMIKDAGVGLTLIGHSERRHLLKDDNAVTKQKAENAIRAGMGIVLCVGEPLDVREAGKSDEYVTQQLRDSWPENGSADKMVIAYEPVWAIGTGKTASLEDIAAMHAVIKRVAPVENPAIVYGGSVTAENARQIMETQGVDGVLVGGASLKAGQFQSICEAAL